MRIVTIGRQRYEVVGPGCATSQCCPYGEAGLTAYNLNADGSRKYALTVCIDSRKIEREEVI